MKPKCMTQEQYDLWLGEWPETRKRNKKITPCYDCNPEYQGKMIREFRCSNPGYCIGPNFAFVDGHASGGTRSKLENYRPDIIREIKEGYSSRELAEKYGTSQPNMCHYAKKLGMKFHSQRTRKVDSGKV